VTKYNANKVKLDGIKFDSQMESLYYKHLKILEKANIISFFVCHPQYILQDSYRNDEGVKIRAIKYIADFEVTYPDGRVEIVDIKGKETEVFKIKKKLFEYRYPGKKIICMKHTKTWGWETLEEAKLRGKKK
jgi:hypothetical protein